MSTIRHGISVVVPAFNAEGHLPALLDRIEAQTLSPDEIVIVDSSSTERSAERIRAHKGAIPIVYRKVDFAYPGRARNIGVEAARGEWIAFLDCRTTPRPDWLESCVATARATGAQFVRGLCVSDSDTVFKRMLQAVTYGRRAWPTLPGSLVSKGLFERSGGLAPDVRAGEDLDWMERVAAAERTAMPSSPTIRYSGFPETMWEAVKKWYVYALANATIEVRNNHKNLYLAILIAGLVVFAYRWNATFAIDESDPFYLRHVTKISVAVVALAYAVYRGIIRPRSVDVELPWLLPWRWIALAFIAICLDLAKAPGLIWGSLLLLNRRLRSAWVRMRRSEPSPGRPR